MKKKQMSKFMEKIFLGVAFYMWLNQKYSGK
jgi:hypothetical protein